MLTGGFGQDTLVGQRGNDRLDTVDRVSGNDVARCGPSKNDVAVVDQGDLTVGCEQVIVG